MTDTPSTTLGPFAVHGVMVSDTTETAGGMFCIRTVRTVTGNAGVPMPSYGEVVAYAYRRIDAEVMAAAPAMLRELLEIRADLATLRDMKGDPFRREWAHSIIGAMDEIPVVAEAAARVQPVADRLEDLRTALDFAEASLEFRGSGKYPSLTPEAAELQRETLSNARAILASLEQGDRR